MLKLNIALGAAIARAVSYLGVPAKVYRSRCYAFSCFHAFFVENLDRPCEAKLLYFA